MRGVAVTRRDHFALLNDIGEPVREPRRRRLAVTTRAPRLLVVALHRLRQVEVGHEPHVGLVDPHAEGDRRHHDEAVLAQEARLIGRAHLTIEARVVRQGRDALALEERRRLLHRCPREAVDDAGVARVLRLQEREELLLRRVLRDDPVGDVRPVEVGNEVPCALELEAGRDLAARGVGGRGGESDARHAGPALVQHRQPQVIGPEVVAPLRHAVRLVDGEQGDARVVEQPLRLGHEESLGREIEQVELAREEGLLGGRPLVGQLRRVEEAGAHAEGREGVHLVGHERDERRDDDARPLPHERRHLVAQRFAATGRHENESVAPGDELVDDGRLITAEVVVPPHALQHLTGSAWCSRRGVRGRHGVGLALVGHRGQPTGEPLGALAPGRRGFRSLRSPRARTAPS